MKRLPFRKQISIFAICALILTVCLTLSFLTDRSSFARGMLGSLLSILASFIAGGIIAFILKPICNRLDGPIGRLFVNKLFRWRLESGRTTERRLHRAAERVSILIAMLFFFGVFYALLHSVLPHLFASIVQIVQSVPDYLQSLTSWILSVLGEDNPLLTDQVVDVLTNVNNYASEWLKNSFLPMLESFLAGNAGSLSSFLAILNGTINMGATLIGLILDIIVSIVVSVYVLGNRKKFAHQGKLLIHTVFPKKWADIILSEAKYANHVFSRFLTGRMLDSLLVGILIFIACSILGIPQRLLVSVLVGASNMIPFFGPYIGTIPSALIILMIDPIKFFYFLALVLIIQQIDSNILDPMVVGNAIEMSGFWILFSVLFFGGLFGFAGLLLGVPTFAIIYDIVRKLVNYGLDRRGEGALMEEYRQVYHDPCDDPAYLREKAKTLRRERKAARSAAAAEAISKLVHEAQASGTTEALVAEEAFAADGAVSSERDGDTDTPDDTELSDAERSEV